MEGFGGRVVLHLWLVMIEKFLGQNAIIGGWSSLSWLFRKKMHENIFINLQLKFCGVKYCVTKMINLSRLEVERYISFLDIKY